MRVYIPRGAGLGANDISALKRLSRPALAVIADELQEPGSHEAIRWVLRQRNPEQALHDVIQDNVREATDAVIKSIHSGSGLSDVGMGKSFFKRLVKANRRIFNATRRITAKMAKHDPIYKATTKIRKRIMNAVRKFAPIIITVAGGVLGPFTGGASVAAAAVLVTAYELRKKKIEADKAVRAGKVEAGQMQAQVAQQNTQVQQQADTFYSQNQNYFATAGYDQTAWNALSLDQKVNLIQQASAGTLPASPQAVQQVQQAQAQGVLPPTQPGQVIDPSQAYIPSTTTPAQDAATAAAATPADSAPPADAGAPAAQAPDVQAAPPGPPPQAGPTESTDETTGLPTAGGYTVTVEGKPITNYPVSLSTLSSVIASGTQPGDRFEISADGQPTGLRVRTVSGFISIPDSMRAQVMAMPHDQVLALLTQAANNVADAGGPPGPAPVPSAAKGGTSAFTWLALAGAAAAAATMAGGRKGQR